MTEQRTALKAFWRDPLQFASIGGGLRLRRYQQEVARQVVDSVMEGRGLSLVVMFPRQSGKNELQAQIEAYLLLMLSTQQAEIIKVSPTWRPQSLNAMRRIEQVLQRNLLTRGRWKKESGYIYRIETARLIFLSGAPTANVVGHTAKTLLECDEAQDVEIPKWDKDIAPMAASTNATRVFWGTAWTASTLLARELRAAQTAQEQDGIRRVWRINAESVAAEVPAYDEFVAGQVARLGRQHPLVITQFFSEELDAAGGMFPPARLALMRGQHPAQMGPLAGHTYACTLDVGGEGGASEQGEHDATALTVFDIEEGSPGPDSLSGRAVYRVVSRRMWQGTPHVQLYGEIRALLEHWQPVHTVIDATGLGAGLAAFWKRWGWGG